MAALMEAVARRREGYTHDVEVRGHTIVADEPEDRGGGDRGATPQELVAAALASCTAITMEMYADRKGWDVGELEVLAEFEPGPRGECDSFAVTLRLPKELSEEQAERLKTIASKCPVHRTLQARSEVSIADRVELV